MRVSLLLPLLLLLPACYASPLPQQTTSPALAFSEFVMVKLKLGDKLIEVQLADSPERRSQGLMGQSPFASRHAAVTGRGENSGVVDEKHAGTVGCGFYQC